MIVIGIITGGILCFISGFMVGKKIMFMRNQRQIDKHTEYLRNTLYHLITFGLQQGFPFDETNKTIQITKSNITEKEALYISLKKALELEQYEEACYIRDQIKNYKKKDER